MNEQGLIKVLIVDDSALIRSLLSEIVKQSTDMVLVGAAPDAYRARDLVNQYQPDVITLDVEMPKVDGLTFLEKLMKARPTPVIMISSLTEAGADVTLRALELGAVDFIAKPKLDVVQGIESYRTAIIEKIRSAARANVKRLSKTEVSAQDRIGSRFKTTEKILAIGASTGGTEAIKQLLQQLPVDSPGIVMTQHMPPGFTRTFAARLDACCAMKVVEAQGGERIMPGTAYLAPGHLHLTVKRSGADYQIALDDRPRVSGHKPSVDVMFSSVAEAVGENAVAVLLTGMGKDGALGMQQIAHQQGYTIAQNEESCVIFGMPREAIKTGTVREILPLDAMGERILAVFAAMGTAYRI
jgi:two-component system chemotaxis response regulator CheB